MRYSYPSKEAFAVAMATQDLEVGKRVQKAMGKENSVSPDIRLATIKKRTLRAMYAAFAREWIRHCGGFRPLVLTPGESGNGLYYTAYGSARKESSDA
jgi:hypothetical protein